MDDIEALQKLVQLKESGVLTGAEFEEQKKKLLGRRAARSSPSNGGASSTTTSTRRLLSGAAKAALLLVGIGAISVHASNILHRNPRRSANTITPEDTLRVKTQRSFFPVFLGKK